MILLGTTNSIVRSHKPPLGASDSRPPLRWATLTMRLLADRFRVGGFRAASHQCSKQ